VASETSLGELHEILQNAFDWRGEHLHRFFAFALLPFYLLKQQRSGRNFTHAPLFPEFPNFVQRDNGFWHTFMHQKRCFSANVLPSHSLRRRKYQVIDHHTALGLGMRCPGVTVKPHDSISSEPRSDVARSPMHRQSRFVSQRCPATQRSGVGVVFRTAGLAGAGLTGGTQGILWVGSLVLTKEASC